MDPGTAIAIGQGAVGLGKALFGRKKKFKTPKIDPFVFNPNENDPELGLRRRRASEEIVRDRGRTTSEIGRAGLLGSGASFGIMNEASARGSRLLSDIDADAFTKQRSEALDLYNRDNEFKRQVALQELGGDLDSERVSGYQSLSSLGDIGNFVGSELGLSDRELTSLLKLKNRKTRQRLLGDDEEEFGYQDYDLAPSNRRIK